MRIFLHTPAEFSNIDIFHMAGVGSSFNFNDSMNFKITHITEKESRMVIGFTFS